MRGVEEDEVRRASVDVLRRQGVLGADPEPEARVVSEPLGRDVVTGRIAVERIEAGLGVEREEEVEGAVAAEEAELDHRSRANHARERMEHQRLVALYRSLGGSLLVAREVREVRHRAPAQRRPAGDRGDFTHGPTPMKRPRPG